MYSLTNDLPTALRQTLQQGELPGRVAQFEMAHRYRDLSALNLRVPADARPAAVLNLLYPSATGAGWCVVLMRRVAFDPKRDKHSGQVSFPGGRFEAADQTLERTALREAEEEIGIAAADIAVLGAMTPLYIPISNFLVHPYLAAAYATPVFQPNSNEVAHLIHVAVTALLAADVRKQTNLTLANGLKIKNVPYFDIQENVVWGATAMILSEFVALVRRSGWSG